MTTVDFVDKAKRYIPSSANVALNLGCGKSEITLKLGELNVIACDIDGRAIDELRKKIENTRFEQKIKLINCDVRDFPYQDYKNIDLIICANVLHFIPNDQAAQFISIMINCLKKSSGIIAFSYVMDKKGLPAIIASALINNLEIIEMQCDKVFDSGHEGNPEPHEHMIFYCIGRRRK